MNIFCICISICSRLAATGKQGGGGSCKQEKVRPAGTFVRFQNGFHSAPPVFYRSPLGLTVLARVGGGAPQLALFVTATANTLRVLYTREIFMYGVTVGF